MIYVCRIDTGNRHIFDFADGIENVGSLATVIEKQFKIEKSKQIMLISGGEVLDDHQRKFYGFGFGCEESPIYLIDKNNVERKEPPLVQTQLDLLNFDDMKQQINAAFLLKPSFETLHSRSQLTIRINDFDKYLNKLCQSLYDEQYWQYQGYLALIANLDDFISSFRKKEKTVREKFDFFFSNVNNYKNIMKNMNKYMDVLSRTRLLPSLLAAKASTTEANIPIGANQSVNNVKTLNSTPVKTKLARKKSDDLFNSASTQSINNLANLSENLNPKTTLGNLSEDISLLDWIKSTDAKNRLEIVVDDTRDILENFEKNQRWNELNQEINEMLTQVEENSQFREIEGLTKRLDDLKNLLDESNRLLIGQNEISETFKANFERANSLRDESVLKDLCKAHVVQLEMFKNNHLSMVEIATKINKAKLELIKVIHSRLQWIMQIQKKVVDYDFRIQIFFKQLKRLNIRLKLMEQLQKAPYIYVYSMKETLRRLDFAKNYNQFAKLVHNLVSQLYTNELNQRKLFHSKTMMHSQHFILNILFPSLSEPFEPLLNELRANVDDNLPHLDDNEVGQVEAEIMGAFKENESYSTASPLQSSCESLSSQASPSTSGSGSSASTVQVNSSINFENESYFLKELNMESNGANSKFKVINESGIELGQMKRLTDFILNSGSSECHNCSNLCQKNSALSDGIESLRKNLDQTRSMVLDYQTNVNDYVTKLNECNKMIAKLNENSKSQIYEKVIVQIGNFLDESGCQEIVADLDPNFVNQLKTKIDDYRKNQDAKLAKIKQNNNAENQVKFNEAINRVVVAKDKKIEELKQLQTNYIDKITCLELEIKKLKLKLSSSHESAALDAEIDTNKTTHELLNCDQAETNSKLKELMLQEKINELKKQLDMFHTLPVTNNFYETIQINSCNIDDLVLAVYSEEHGSYRVVHKTSNYLHFVYSAVFKSFEHKLSIKTNNSGTKLNAINTSQYSSSPQNDQSDIVHLNENVSNGQYESQPSQSVLNSVHLDNTVVDGSENIFNAEKQPQWFVGKVLVKEFCVARKENNRFKVPGGTRFYRVKLKPYNLI
uniref:RB1-inducible coiled-coil protein 1 n=1 Tax=Brachionus rotundiformis TaxID=96890 RepID=A0A2Z4EUM8_9BILA|nr:RB1-inducible coiled-coil protein 1 [Brachionus rotundiformis]